MSTPRIRIPDTAQKGVIIEIKALIDHPMETGQRKGADGKILPKRIIDRFEVSLNGQVVFAADWGTGIAANPFISFFLTATESGEFKFSWRDEQGPIFTATKTITVN